MIYVLTTLIIVDLIGFVATFVMGFLLESGESLRLHFTMGVVTTILICFTHCLILFYLIGTEGDIREALAEHADMAEKYSLWAKDLKWRAFPWGSLSMLMIIVAALLGAEVHSRLLLESAPSEDLPLRQVAAWWVHLGVVLIALAANVFAMGREYGVVRENRRGIDEINDELARRNTRSAPAESS